MTADAVTLRTGLRVHPVTVYSTQTNVGLMVAAGHAVAAYELVQLARNPQHHLFEGAAHTLARFGLLRDGVLHRDTAAVVDAMFDDEGLSMVTAVAA